LIEVASRVGTIAGISGVIIGLVADRGAVIATTDVDQGYGATADWLWVIKCWDQSSR
jgi:hypothetical protein